MEKKIQQPARDIIRKIIYSPINLKDGIKVLWDTPLNHHQCLNILMPIIPRQYYGANVDVIRESSELSRPYLCMTLVLNLSKILLWLCIVIVYIPQPIVVLLEKANCCCF